MELFKISENIYHTSHEKERDRPRLGYIKGKRFSVAIDAGFSDEHVHEFYDLLKQQNLPLPLFTILTHWHWDHTFAMHAINGMSICSKNTNRHLREFIANRNELNDKAFRNCDPSIALEYPNNKEIFVVDSDIEYENRMVLNNGDQDIQIFRCPSPHTDDCSLIYVPNEKILFVGDGISGMPPDWRPDAAMAKEFADFIQPLDIELTIGGHWENMSKDELIKFMLSYL